MKKLFTKNFLLLILSLGIIQGIWGQNGSITIIQTSSSITQTGYNSGAERQWTQDGVSFGATYVMKESGQPRIQLQANTGNIYNKTALPGRILSITINGINTSTSSLYCDVSQISNHVPSQQVGTASSAGWAASLFNETDYLFFKIQRGSNAAYWNSLVIEYEKAPTLTAQTFNGTNGLAFSQTITNTGSAAEFEVSASTVDQLPAGLTLNSATGVISGSPTEEGTFNVTITATNPTGSDEAVYTINIIAPLATPVLTAQTFNGTTGVAFTQTITNTGDPAEFLVTAGDLPAGLTLATSTGEISGTPTTVETQVVTITATNTGGTASAQYTFNIVAPITAPVLEDQTFNGTTDLTFSHTITNTGSAATFEVSASTVDQLPAGLTLNTATGVISGTPTELGTFFVTISATNVSGSDEAVYTINVIAPLAIPVLTDETFDGITGEAFSETITNTGDAATFAITAGSLPAGLTLNTSTGEISGTPTTVETQVITISATNTGGTDNAEYTFNIVAPIIAPDLEDQAFNGTTGIAFSQTIANTGSVATFAITNGSLPAGLELDETTGVISGTANLNSTSTVEITATNLAGSDVANYTINIYNLSIPTSCFSEDFNTLIIGNHTTTGGQGTAVLNTETLFTTVNNVYKAGKAIRIGSGSNPGSIKTTTFSTTSDSVKISYDVKGWTTVEGSIKVTLGTQTQTLSHTAKIADPWQRNIMSFYNVPTNTNLVLSFETTSNRAFIDSIVITCFDFPCIEPTTQASVFSATNITTSGAEISYTRGNGNNVLVIANVSTSESTLPTQGTAYYTGSAFGTSGAVVAYNGPNASFNMASLLTNTTYHLSFYEYNSVDSCYNVINPLTGSFTTLMLPPVLENQTFNIETGTQFTTTIPNTGSTADLYEVSTTTADQLPTGFTLGETTGEITGTPTVAGTFVVTIEASNNGGSDIANYTFVITDPLINAPVLEDQTFNGTTGIAFNQTITNTGSPATFIVSPSTADQLPAGLDLEATTGEITGTPTELGTFVVTISATNVSGSDEAVYTINIVAPLAIPVLEDQTFNGITGEAFTETISNNGDAATFAITAGTLPAGLSLETSTGVISGTPTTVETQIVTISATNTGGTDNAEYTFNIVAPIIAPAIEDQTFNGTIGSVFNQTITNTGSEATFVTTNGSLPAGLSLVSTTGEITGTPTELGTFVVTISATNVSGSDIANYTININNLPVPTSCFSEDFINLTGGSNTNTGANFPIITNTQTLFPITSQAYQGQGSVKLGSGSNPGSLKTTTFSTTSDSVKISYDVKGWTNVEGDIKVTLGTQTQTLSHTAKIADPWETKTITFYNVPTNTNLVLSFETTSRRAFLDNIVVTCYETPCNEPTTQASAFSATNITTSGAEISYTRGNGNNVLVIAKSGSIESTLPTQGTAYYTGNTFGTSGAVVAYNGPNASFNMASLLTNITYHLSFYEYNSVDSCYNVTDPLTGSFTTLMSPPILENQTFNIETGTQFTTTITNTGSTADLYEVSTTTADQLPTGLTLDETTGEITGTTTVVGTYVVTIEATNISGTDAADYTFVITAPIINAPELEDQNFTGVEGTSFTEIITNTGSAATFEVTATSTDQLPAGLVLNATSGVITGTPTVIGTFVVSIEATNASGSDIANYTFTITEAPTNTACFSEDFSALTQGGNTENSGANGPTGSVSSTATLFTTFVGAQQAGGAIKIGTSGAPGSMATNSFIASSSDVTLNVDVKGWTTAGSIRVTLGTQIDTIEYTAVMSSSSYDARTLNFSNVPVNTPILFKLETIISNRAFFDNVSIICSPVVCTVPTTQSTDFSATNITTTTAEINYTRGNGDNVLVIAKAGSAEVQAPASGTEYIVNDAFGSNGAFVAYNGPASNFTLSTLTGSTNYYLTFYEYASVTNCYNTTAPLNGNFATLDIAPILDDEIYTGTVGTSFSRTITNTGGVATLYVLDNGNFPQGLSLDSSTGEISGIPTVEESQIVTITASNSAGSSTANYRITIDLAPVSNYCFEEDFSEILEGNNTDNSGSGTTWDGGLNWTVDRAYQAGGAVKLGTSGSPGSIETAFTPSSTEITIDIDVKGWASNGGSVIVSLGSQSDTVAFTAAMSDNFETVTVNFSNVSIGQSSTLKVATNGVRLFVDQINVTCASTCVTTSSITRTACTSYTAPDGQVFTTSGIKTVTLANANVEGCDSIISIDLTITGNPVITNIITATETDASIDVTITGGTAPYVYLWSNGASTEDLQSVTNGSYTVTVQDANNCTSNATIVVSTVSVQSIEGIKTTVYPNPSTGYFTIAFNNHLNGTVSMTDLSGKIIYTNTFDGTFIPMNVDVENGIYLVNIVTKQGTIVERVSIK